MIDLPSFQELQNWVVQELQNNQWFKTVGFFGILTIIWASFKKVPLYIWIRIKRRITYSVSIYETDIFYEYFENWLTINHKNTYRNVEARIKYIHHESPIKEIKQTIVTDAEVTSKSVEEVSYKQFIDLFYIKRGFRYLKVFKGRDKLENANSLQNAFLNRFEISGIMSKKVINRLMDDVLNYNLELQDKNKSTKIKIFANNSFNWRRMDDINPKTLDKVILDGKKEIIDDIEDFIANKKWYEDRSILHKRGYLLYGKPGNGKTILSMAIAKHLNRDLYFLNPSKITDEDLINLYANLQTQSILVIEDIDAIFDKNRKKDDDNVKFNFSTLLNCLDGAFSKEGIITIFSTNHPERLDDALIRTGRMDYKFEITNPSKVKIEEYLNIFFNKQDCYIDFYGTNYSLPMVKVQDICIRNKNSYLNAKKKIESVLTEELLSISNGTTV